MRATCAHSAGAPAGRATNASRRRCFSADGSVRRTHRTLLGAGTIVLEGLNLRDVEPGIYDLYCLPLRVVGSDGAPARVVLRKA